MVQHGRIAGIAMPLEIPHNTVKALLIFAGEKDARHFLNAVFVEPSPDGTEVNLIATDGHRLLCVHLEQKQPIPHELREPFLLAREALETLHSSTAKLVLLGHNPNGKGVDATLVSKTDTETHITLPTVGGNFIDWRTPVRKVVAHPKAHSVVNSAYLVDAVQSARLLARNTQGKGTPVISSKLFDYRGSGGIVLSYPGGEAIGVIMAYADDHSVELPQWAQATLQEPAPERMAA